MVGGALHLATAIDAVLAFFSDCYSDLFTDHRTGRTLDVFTTTWWGQPVWAGDVGWFNSNRDYRAPERLSGGLVLLEDQFYEPRFSNARGSVPDWLMAVPSDWDVRWMDDNSELALFSTSEGDDRPAAEGGGNVELRCLVHTDEGRVEPNLVSLWGVPAPLRTAGGACRAPADGSFRLGMTITGPIEVTLGRLDVTVDADGADGAGS